MRRISRIELDKKGWERVEECFRYTEQCMQRPWGGREQGESEGKEEASVRGT